MQSLKSHQPKYLYQWPNENEAQLEAVNTSHNELKLQLLLLNKRVDILSNMLKEQLNFKQQQNLAQRLNNN